ncbi:MAG: RtcB family protein, partial [Halobacteriaceae archaeon]
EDVALNTVYDVAHNIAKKERHVIDGEEREVYVHRKGATRAFPPGHEEIPDGYQDAGQPVLIPGSMGTNSYILAGRKYSTDESFGSACHGAGRVMSRTEAKQRFDVDGVTRELMGRNIYVKSASDEGVTEEAPGAYKDVADVIDVVEAAGLAESVARLQPIGVVKG